MPQTIWIARHGNRLDFVNPDWFLTAERPYDPPLSNDGVIQAQQLAKRLVGENITHIFASPFLRTVQTANQVAEFLDLSIKLDWGLCEWLNPDWMSGMPETLPLEVLMAHFPRIDTAHFSGTPRYPETGEACLKRAGDTAKRLASQFPENLLFVGHGASVQGAAMGLVPEITPDDIQASLCCLVKIVRHPQKWVMELNGDTSHLTRTEAALRFH